MDGTGEGLGRVTDTTDDGMYRSLFENSPVGMWHEDLSGLVRFLRELPATTADELRRHLRENPEVVLEAASRVIIRDVNARLIETFAAPSKESLLTGISRDMATPEWIEAFREQLVAVWNGETAGSAELVVRDYQGNRLTGTLEWFATDPAYSSVVISFYDTTERDRLARVVAAVSAGDRAVLTSDDEGALLREVCRIIVEEGGYLVAWAGFADDGPGNRIVPVAGWGAEDEYLASISVTWDDSDLGRGPSGTALRTGRPVVIQDVRGDERLAPWREDARRRGVAAIASVPLLGEGFRGVLTVQSGRGEAFEPTEVELLERFASNLSVGLVALRARGRNEETRRGLEALVRAKDEFLATVAHELRTPLTSIVGFAEVLRDGTDGVDSRDFIDQIAESAHDLTNIVNDLLVATRTDSGSVRVISEPVDLAGEVERIVVSHTGVGVTVDRRVVAVGDRTRVRQVLRNLLVNAARHGGELVEVLVDGDDEHAWVDVRDDGRPIPAGLVEQIFDPYVRGEEPASDTPGSMGLGLHVSRTLARLMGGDLTIHQGDGWVTFRLSLPRSSA